MPEIPRTIIIPDIHGSARALDASLRHAGNTDQLITLGDYFDRGDENLQVLQRLLELREQFGECFMPIAGNHEYLLARATQTPAWRNIESWIESGGHAVLREIALANGYPVVSGTVYPIADIPSYYQANAKQVMKQKNLEGIDTRQAFEWLQEDMRNGEFAKFFRLLMIAAEAHRACIAVHSSISEQNINVDELNTAFRTNIVEEGWSNLQADYYNMMDVRLGEQSSTENPNTRLDLVRRGIGLVFRGHCIQKHGKPKVTQLTQPNLTVVSLDVGMSHGIKGPGEWCYGAVNSDGSVVAKSNASRGSIDVGQIQENGIFRAKS